MTHRDLIPIFENTAVSWPLGARTQLGWPS